MSSNAPTKSWGTGAVLLFIVLPLIAGILLSLLIPRPIIGIIQLNDAIMSNTAQDMITQITYARQNPAVRAVVLVINSPGGTVTDTESVYLELNRLRQVKPIVTVVEGMAASGAYYISVGTDYIFAKPSSEVGNVGVIGNLPPTPLVMEDLYSTGPYKLWGEPRDAFINEIETLKQGFIQAVMLGRGSALKTSKETVLRGQIWTGSEALKLGLIDALGTQSQAYDKAAKMAHVSHYEVEDLREPAGVSPTMPSIPFFMKSADGMVLPYPAKPGIYMLYVPPAEGRP